MNRNIGFLTFLFIVFCCMSCASGTETNDNVQVYLQALDALELEKIPEAVDLLLKSSEEEHIASASFATEKLIPLLYEQGDFSEVLAKTRSHLEVNTSETEEKLYYQVDINFLYRYMHLAMIEEEDKTLESSLYHWLHSTPFSQEHNLFFSSEEFLEYAERNPIGEVFLQEITIKTAIYKRDYGQAIRAIINAPSYDRENPENSLKNVNALLLSDIGKAFLYGTNDNAYFAGAFEKASLAYTEKTEEAFMCHFYAGRLYKKEGRSYRMDALSAFEKAMETATRDLDYDTALWYFLETTREGSSRSAITALQEYASMWKDSYYFDDFLEDLAFQLLDNENYKGFVALYEFMQPYFSPESLSKFAYISGILIKEGLTEGEKTESAKDAFFIAYNAMGGSLYYRMMASVELQISSEKVLTDLLKREKEQKEIDTEFEYILGEMLSRGSVFEAYSLYSKHSHLVSVEGASLFSRNLSEINTPSLATNYEDNFYPESLRVVSRAFSQSEKDILKEDMELLYPRYYTEIVMQTSEVYDLEEFIIYAIMRSESFFDHDVMSWAGAIGLTQLMPSTAGDVARKLRVTDYDLHNARQNIDFGMFYFDELLPREGVENSVLRALFAYNAGITNVRRWNRTFPELAGTPELFLEKIPFAETREYGRKVLSAAVMYGLLYYDMEVEEVVNAIMN